MNTNMSHAKFKRRKISESFEEPFIPDSQDKEIHKLRLESNSSLKDINRERVLESIEGVKEEEKLASLSNSRKNYLALKENHQNINARSTDNYCISEPPRMNIKLEESKGM